MLASRKQDNRKLKLAEDIEAAPVPVRAHASIDPELLRRWQGRDGDDSRQDEIHQEAEPVTAKAPAEKAPAADAAAGNKAGAPKRSKRTFAIAGVLVATLVAGGYYGERWYTAGRFMVSTDDAYVRAHNTTLAAKVSGYLSAIPLEDNEQVHAGDVIARIDDGDYKLAVESARGKVATQQATVARYGQQIVAQQANIEQARAQLASAEAGETRAASEFQRQQALAGREFASRQTFEQALANRDQAHAAVQSAQAAVDAAEANVGVLKAQQDEASHTLDEYNTALAKAQRDLSFTVIRAPVDGVFGNRAVQTGDFVQTGQRLASLVPLDEVYVDANFKETQLAHLKPGQPVSISVDALPDHAIEGRVASMSPASGSVFSLLPPDNATGNFTKIIQRVPVRISVPLDVATKQLLRPGMSVVVSVNTKQTDETRKVGDNGAMPAPAAKTASRS